MNRRKMLAAGSALFAVLALVLAPLPASAAEPVGPVDEIADVTSRLVKSVTGSPMGDKAVLDVLKAMKAMNTALAGGGEVVATAAPKLITSPAALTRVGGTAIMAPMLGWGIASNGTLVAVAVATGSTYEDVACSQPDWYQGVTNFVNLAIAPDCTALIPQPNPDVTATLSALTGGGVTLVYKGAASYSGAGTGYYCYSSAGAPSGTFGWRWKTQTGSWSAGFTDNVPGCKGVYGATAWVGRGQSGATAVVGLFDSSVSSTVPVSQMTYTTPNPWRTPKCDIEWENGTTTSGTGTPYQETSGLPLTAAGLGCEQAYVSQPGRGPDLLPRRISVGSEMDGGAITEISDQEVPEFGPDERKAFEPGNGRGLVLEKVVGATVDSCMTWAADCAGWWEETDEGTSTTSPYRCLYAGALIDLAECGPYRYTFDTKTQTPTITDPITGEQAEWSAGPNSGNSINPGTGPGTGPSPADACFASGWASVANPIDWVLVPVKCALVWAFVPRPAVVNQGFEGMGGRWQSTAVGGLSAAVAGWSFVAPSSSGCDGITVAMSEIREGLDDFQILNACAGEPLQPIAALSTLVIGIGAVLTAIGAVTGSIGGIVGMRRLGGGDAT